MDFIDLFAGIGGMRLGLEEAGGKCVFSSEIDRHAQDTYEANFGERPLGDIRDIGEGEIPFHDILLAGFPCQPFSQAGLKQGFSDTRGTLFFDIQRIISHHRPPIVLLENVKQLKGHDQGRTLKTITSVLEGNSVDIATNETTISVDATRARYHVSWRILNAKDYGVPQNRERIFILALRTDLFSLFDAEAVFSRTKTRTKDSEKLGSILQPTSEVDESYTLSDKLWAGHKRRRDEHANKGYGFGYSLFNNDSPYSSTISARYYKDGSEILIDQSHLGKNPRMITPREAARIQGYPENFVISACLDSEIYRQFGNSVALPVVRSLAQEITPLLEQIPQTSGPSK